jgi:hypothetical protein
VDQKTGENLEQQGKQQNVGLIYAQTGGFGIRGFLIFLSETTVKSNRNL